MFRELVEDYKLLIEIGNTRLSPDEFKTTREKIGSTNPSIDVIHKSEHVKYNGYNEASYRKYHKDHSGIVHDVDWDTRKSKIANSDKSKVLSHALALHHNYIENHTEPGDIVKNTPKKNTENSGIKTDTNKRASIYAKKAGFGEMNPNGHVLHKSTQYGIVRKHADDHPEEHKRGKKYLEPIHTPDFDSRHSDETVKNNINKLGNTNID